MIIDWKQIRTIFQVPASWYSDLQDAVYRSYGSQFITVTHNAQQGGIEIGIDEDIFQQYIDQFGSGKVRTVDDIEPDENGNIKLTDVIRTINHSGPDRNGNLDIKFDKFVQSVDGVLPDKDTGAVDFNLDRSAWMKTDAQGHISTTDEVPVAFDPTKRGFVLWQDDEIQYRPFGTAAKTVAEGNHTHTTADITDVDLTNVLSFDDIGVYVSANQHRHSYQDIDLLDQYLATILGDAAWMNVGKTEGTVASGDHGHGMITSNGRIADGEGDIEDAILATDLVGSITALKDENGTTYSAQKLAGLIDTFQDIIPITSASSGKTFKIDANGKTTLIDPKDEWVDLTNDQTIDGNKTFVKPVKVIDTTTSDITSIWGSGITFNSLRSAIYFRTGEGTSGSSIVYEAGNGFLDISNLIGSINISSVNGFVDLTAKANCVRLAKQPTDTSKDSLAIATVGYVQTHGGGEIPEDVLKTEDIDANDTGRGVCGADYGDQYYTGTTKGAIGQLLSDVDGIKTFVGSEDHSTLKEYTDTFGYVQSVDGHTPSDDGSVSFGLAPSKFVKTDSEGHLYTTDEKVISVPDTDTPVNQTLTMVTGVTWTSPNIVVSRRELVFRNGVLVKVNTLSNTTIATTTYTP